MQTTVRHIGVKRKFRSTPPTATRKSWLICSCRRMPLPPFRRWYISRVPTPFGCVPAKTLHVKVPVLMVNGRYDNAYPLETSQKPMFRLLGTPPASKRHEVFEAGHIPPNDLMRKDILDWLDRNQGPVQ